MPLSVVLQFFGKRAMIDRKASPAYTIIMKINMIAASLAGAILLFVTLSIFVDVILRYFFNRPSIWVTEVSSYLFMYIIFLAAAYTLQQGMHIRVTFLLDIFSPGVRRIIELFTSLFVILFCIALLWQTSVMTWTAFKEKWTSPTMLSAPYAYIYVVMVIGSSLLVFTFILRMIVHFIEYKQESSDSEG